MRRPIFSAAAVLLLSALPTCAESPTGTVCVVPNPPGCCTLLSGPFDLKTLIFKIDNGNKTPWPQKVDLKIEGVSLEEKHLVVVYSGGKPIHSFRFRFTDRKETELCLLFDGYGLPDLRLMGKWCGCKLPSKLGGSDPPASHLHFFNSAAQFCTSVNDCDTPPVRASYPMPGSCARHFSLTSLF